VDRIPLLRAAGPLVRAAGAALVALVALVACSSAPADTGPPGSATVVYVIDGDTIVARIGGTDERIRLIGIDTPETVAPNRPVECFGPEASARAEELLPAGTAIRLERDVEARDRYDRLLAYVFRADDDLLVNLVLVEEGMAEASSFPPNTARDPDFSAAEARARGTERGLWGACG
jgi:micrococcal nuclease